MRKLFLDANIILDFYRYGNDDLDELQKLVALIAGDEIKLYTNDHLHSEVRRNREGVVSQMLDELQKHKFRFRSPKICDGHAEVEKISALLKEANTLLSALSKEVENKAINLKLRADTYIDEMFDAAQNTSLDDAKYQQADLRSKIGDPPGKPGSLGDGVHWLSLLDSDAHSLDLVTKDGDFSSKLNSKTVNPFLSAEWVGAKGEYASVTLYTSLGDYLRAHFPNIQLSEEETKNELIDQLAASSAFASSHEIIEGLQRFSFFTAAQVSRLFGILVQNNQVGWIGEDEDIKSFFVSLKDKAHAIPYELMKPAAEYLGVDEDDFFIPF